MSSNSSQRNNRDYKKPVAWLLGRQLLASLKGTLLYTAFGSKLDARDWMHAEEFPSAKQAEADDIWQKYADRFWPESGTDYWKRNGEFWFDYLSDTGDGVRATYSIAYLCYSNLWLDGSLREWQQNFTALSDQVGFVVRPDFIPQEPDQYANADRNREQIDSESQTELPRGAFLLVGGDTTYHMSDYEGLHTRFQTPFNWAFEDAKRDGRLWKQRGQKWDKLRRPLFGIPGNHDYYDQLDGFRRQFRNQIKKDEETPPGRELEGPQLMIDGFMRCQQSSYVALRLPFNWLLWGLDTEIGKIDDRQRHFFRNIKFQNESSEEGQEQKEASIETGETPDKLIVATCAPTTVFGKYADRDDEKSAKAFFQLGLPRPFLDPADQRGQDEEEEPKLKEHQCRLDLSGDIHHYARYWGRDSRRNPRKSQAKKAICWQSDNYASVVSGLGGAFHHPSTTYADQIREQALYPSVDESRTEVARRIFKPWNIVRGGGVWAIGFILAFLFYFAATVATSSRQAIDNFPPLVWAGMTRATDIYPTVPKEAPRVVERHWLNLWYYIYGKTWSPDPQTGRYIHFWGEGAVKAPPEYWVGSILSVASLVLILVALYFAERIYDKYQKREEVARKAMPAPAAGDEEEQGTIEAYAEPSASERFMDTYRTASGEIAEELQSKAWYKKLMEQFLLQLWPLVLLSAIALVVGIFTLQPFKSFLTPFGNSLMMLLTLLWATAAIRFCVRYSDWLSRMASKITIKFRHWLLVWFVSIIAALGVLCTFFIYGHYNTASDTLVDILVTLVAGGVLLGLTLLGAFKVGADGQLGKAYGVLGLVIGFFHAMLQLIIPFLLVRKGTVTTWVMAVVLIVIMQFAGWWLMKGNYYKLLLGTWLIFGSLMLLLPYLTFYFFDGTHGALWAPFLDSFRDKTDLFGPTGMDLKETSLQWRLFACFVAGFVGFWMSCIWLNWYLAIALLYQGHNNEVGGAGRIEKFKQFIRFRLTENDLTGFVIAVDEPQEYGNELEPKLIDVIHLTRKP
jgi:hypothetical protein